MNSFISSGLIASSVFLAGALTCIAGTDLSSGSIVECSPRAGLSNFFAKCEKGGSVKVAYFGGSITAGAGWRVQSLDLFRKLYPQTKFDEIYAAIGGTGSNLGVFRMEQDVLRHKPDLLFVEFAVNDSDTAINEIRKNIEGIVRNTWAAVPDCDIIFVYTLTLRWLPTLQDAKFSTPAIVDEEVATHYGIPTIHMGMEVARLEKEGKLIMKAERVKNEKSSDMKVEKIAGVETNPDGKIPFSQDGVHPYFDTGHILYTAAIERSIPLIKAASVKPGAHVDLPAPLMSDYVKAVRFFPVDAAKMQGKWTKLEKAGETLRNKDFDIFIPSVWKAEPGAELSFEFKGKSLMLYIIYGPDTGFIEVTLDGKILKRNAFDEYSNYWRLAPFFPVPHFSPNKLNSETVHTLKIKVLDDDFDKRSILAKIGREKGYDDKPEAFKGHNLLIGAICIEDGTIILN